MGKFLIAVNPAEAGAITADSANSGSLGNHSIHHRLLFSSGNTALGMVFDSSVLTLYFAPLYFSRTTEINTYISSKEKVAEFW